MPHLDRLAHLDAAARPARGLRLFLLIIAATAAWASSTCARTWYVKVDGTGDAPTIAAATDSSASSTLFSIYTSRQSTASIGPWSMKPQSNPSIQKPETVVGG